jgi:hypothetical protein
MKTLDTQLLVLAGCSNSDTELQVTSTLPSGTPEAIPRHDAAIWWSGLYSWKRIARRNGGKREKTAGHFFLVSYLGIAAYLYDAIEAIEANSGYGNPTRKSYA